VSPDLSDLPNVDADHFRLRVLGRWMRMLTIPNQSSVAKAFMEFDENDRMKPSAYYERVVDVMEELVTFTLLTRDVDADDMLQDLFLRALRQRERFCAILNARAWLFTVARNAMADRLRLQRNEVELPEDLGSEPGEEPAVVANLADCLPRVLSELGPVDREAITLCDLEGLSQAQYAARFGLTRAGAKARVQRARRRLREQLTRACQVRFDAAGQVTDFVPRPARR
jgi:RNA polymerase sigma-70 factor (ECF subfamily)